MKLIQKNLSIGIGNTVNQNILQIDGNDSNLQSCVLYGNHKDSPRSRMQLESDIDLDDVLIDTSEFKKKLILSQKWIKKAQNKDDFGLPTDDIGSKSCSWSSAGLLWSSWLIDGKTEDWWIKCLRWVISQSNSDNGIPIVIRGDHSITDATAFTLMCSSVECNQFCNAANNMCDWILDMQNNGGWKWRIGAENYNFVSTGLALLSLKVYYNMIGKNKERIGHAIKNGLNFLINNRNLDGGWGGFPEDISRPANTGFVTYVLAALGQKKQAIESQEYLESKFISTIGWYNSTDRPASHNVTRLGVPYSLMGLSSISSSNKQLLKSGFDILISRFNNGVYELPETVARSWPTRDFIFACSSIIA